MAKYRGPVVRLSRREGVNLQLKGSRRNDEKVEKRLMRPPGQHGQGRRKPSDYALQLREKQKLKRIYGMLEKQFRLFFKRAARKSGVTGEELISLLESRLDNVVYRLLFSATRRESRQMVSHGLFCVNGRPVTIPSFIVKEGDKIEPRKKEALTARLRASLEKWDDLEVPAWLSLNKKSFEAEVIGKPSKEDAGLPVEEQLIVELYSK